MVCQSCLHIASETFVHNLKNLDQVRFSALASILIGKDDEYEKTHTKFLTQCARILTLWHFQNTDLSVW